jgi:hypothetical protein
MSNGELEAFFQEAQTSGHKAVMISAKSGMDLSIAAFQRFLNLGLSESDRLTEDRSQSSSEQPIIPA